MDEPTRRYYADHAAAVAARYEASGELAPWLRDAFAPQSRILDVGAGSGRDAAALARAGHEVYAVEPCAALRDELARYHQELAGRVFAGELPDALPALDALGGPFDGVLCCAVLQHLPAAALLPAVRALAAMLRAGGRLALSVPLSRPGVDAQARDADGRLFTPIDKPALDRALAAAGLAATRFTASDDAYARPGHTWRVVIGERPA